MDWSETRKRLLSLASGRLERPGPVDVPSSTASGDGSDGTPSGNGSAPIEDPPTAPRAASLCIASGKGGTGKSVVTASLARLLARRGRTLIVDADLGVGNAHILQDVSPETSFVDVVEGRLGVSEVRVPCSEEIDLIAAGSGVPRMADLSAYELHLIATGLEELEPEYRYLLVDSAAGISRQTLAFAGACDSLLVVTTPDLTAMTDAYAFIKVVTAQRTDLRPLLLVNRARDENEAGEVLERITSVCDRFLAVRPRSVGWLPEDPAVAACVNRRGAVAELEPEAEVARALRRAAAEIQVELSRDRARGMGRSLLSEVGFSARFA